MIVLAGKHHHREPVDVWSGAGLRLERLSANGRKQYAVELKGVSRRCCNGEMAPVRRVKCAAKEHDAHGGIVSESASQKAVYACK